MRRPLSLWLPNWSTDRYRRRTHAPPDRPVVLAVTIANHQLIARRCAIAAREGVREGLSLANARAMLDSPVVADFDPTADREALDQLAQWALRFSPTVAIDPRGIHLVGVEPDALVMDITGCEHLFGGEHNLAKRLITELKELHFRARVGVGPTIGSAWAAARFGRDGHLARPKKPQSRRAESPSHQITIITDPREQLADYPVRALRVEHDTAEALAELGIERVGQLIGLPRHQLPARFGDELLLRLDQALGQALDGQDLTPTRPEPPREVEQRFAGPTTQVEAIDLAVQQLLRTLCTQLASREQGVLELVAAFERIPKAGIRPETARESITLSAPARDPKHLWSLLRPKIERLHLGFGIEQITLTAARTGRTRHRQAEHWTDTAERAPTTREFATLIDTLTAKLGRAHVLHMRAAASRLPEQEQILTPAIAPRGTGAKDRETHGGCARTVLVPRPSYMFAKPEPASVIALRPDHPPSLVRWNGDVFHVEHGSGPERLADEWWNADAPQREYFRVRLDDGRWIWIYRQSARWFVHGLWS